MLVLNSCVRFDLLVKSSYRNFLTPKLKQFKMELGLVIGDTYVASYVLSKLNSRMPPHFNADSKMKWILSIKITAVLAQLGINNYESNFLKTVSHIHFSVYWSIEIGENDENNKLLYRFEVDRKNDQQQPIKSKRIHSRTIKRV